MSTTAASASTASAEPAAGARRYSAPAIALHWIVAALIVVQLGLGWWMNEVLPDHSPAQDRIELLHIEVGLTLLLFVVARIATRLARPAPPMPAGHASWERRLAHVVHGLLYVLIVAVPLSGWALVSSRHAPVSFWGLPWPKLPGFLPAAEDARRALGRTLKVVHIWWMIWALLVVVAVHLAGALKHQFDGRPVLWRMVPFLRRPEREA